MTVTQSDKGLAKIAEGASSRRHAETSPVKVKDTHLMNNKLPPAEILCGDWAPACIVFSVDDLLFSTCPVCSPTVCGWSCSEDGCRKESNRKKVTEKK